MQLKEVRQGLFCLEYFTGFLVIVSQTFQMSGLTSLLFYMTFVMTFLLWILTAADQIDRTDLLALGIVFLALLNVVVNGISQNLSFSFGYLKKYIMFSCTILFFSAARKLKPDMRAFRFLEVLYALLGIIFIFMYRTRGRQMEMIEGRHSSYLVFRFSNPNLTAMFLVSMILFLALAAGRERKFLTRALLGIIIAAELQFVYLTQSRNALISLSLFAFFLVVSLLHHKRALRIPRGLILLLILIPLIFMAVYLQVITNPVFQDMFSFFSGEGKSLNARQTIWTNALNVFVQSPLTGGYYQISGGTGVSQAHNSMLDIMVSYGIPVLILVVAFLYDVLTQLSENCTGILHSLSVFAFICALFLGIGEAAMFSGGLGIYLFSGIFLALANADFGEGEYNEDHHGQ